jgi:EpsI family protein
VNQATANPPGKNGWLAFGAVAAAVAAVVLLYWPAMTSLAALWLDTDNTTLTHGFLVAATAVWLLWFKRAALLEAGRAPVNRRHRILACAGLLVAALLWQLAYRAGIQIAYLVLIPSLLGGVVAIVFGHAVARACLLPFGLLYFAIPVWDYFNPIAQGLTVFVVRFALRIVGVPAHFVGNQVQLPSGVFEIQGSCSGLHFVMVALMIATLMGELRADGWRMRLRWLALGLALALLTNWIRVFSIIVIGHLTYMQNYLVRVSHYGYGWALFAVAIACLMWIEHRVPLPARVNGKDSAQPTVASVFAQGRTPSAWAPIAVAILAVPMIMNAIVDFRAGRNWNAEHVSPLPDNVGDWAGAPSTDSRWHPVQPGADVERRGRYVRVGRTIEAFGAWYREQGQRKKLGGFGHSLGGSGDVANNGLLSIGARRYGILGANNKGERSLILYQYVVDGRQFTSALAAQLWYARNTLLQLRSPVSGVVALRAECDADCASAQEALSDFAAKAGDSLWRGAD